MQGRTATNIIASSQLLDKGGGDGGGDGLGLGHGAVAVVPHQTRGYLVCVLSSLPRHNGGPAFHS